MERKPMTYAEASQFLGFTQQLCGGPKGSNYLIQQGVSPFLSRSDIKQKYADCTNPNSSNAKEMALLFCEEPLNGGQARAFHFFPVPASPNELYPGQLCWPFDKAKILEGLAHLLCDKNRIKLLRKATWEENKNAFKLSMLRDKEAAQAKEIAQKKEAAEAPEAAQVMGQKRRKGGRELRPRSKKNRYSEGDNDADSGLESANESDSEQLYNIPLKTTPKVGHRQSLPLPPRMRIQGLLKSPNPKQVIVPSVCTAQSTTDLDQAPPTGSQIGSKTTTALPAITYGEASVLEVDQSTQNERGPRDSLPSILNETGTSNRSFQGDLPDNSHPNDQQTGALVDPTSHNPSVGQLEAQQSFDLMIGVYVGDGYAYDAPCSTRDLSNISFEMCTVAEFFQWYQLESQAPVALKRLTFRLKNPVFRCADQIVFAEDQIKFNRVKKLFNIAAIERVRKGADQAALLVEVLPTGVIIAKDSQGVWN